MVLKTFNIEIFHQNLSIAHFVYLSQRPRGKHFLNLRFEWDAMEMNLGLVTG